jgi:ankyrin repeat protein
LSVANSFVCVTHQLEYKHKKNERNEHDKIFHFVKPLFYEFLFIKQNKKMLSNLICTNQVKLAKQAIENGAVDINEKDKCGNTAIMHASCLGHYEIVEMLLARGANARDCNRYGTRPLHSACFGGNLSIVILLIKHGADITDKDVYGFNPLMKATQEGYTDIVRHLLFLGADPRYKIEITNSLYSGWGPLTVAARHGFFEIVLLLITAACDINLQSGAGDTALILATAWGHESTVH